MLSSIISYSLILGCSLGAIGANYTQTPPPVDDIIHGSPPLPNIVCQEGFEGILGPTGIDAIRRDCYTVIGALDRELVKLKKGAFHAVRNRETGKRLNLHDAMDKSRLLKIDSTYTTGEARCCVINIERFDKDEQNREAILPTAQGDMTLYFYFWERVLDVAKQVLQQCFDDDVQHRAGQQDDYRFIGWGKSLIEGKNWSYPYTVSIDYDDWRLRRAYRASTQGSLRSSHDFWSENSWSDTPADSRRSSRDSRRTLQGSQSNLRTSLADLQDLQSQSQVPPHNRQENRPPPGRLRRICQRIYNSLLCANHIP
jgi:hypothetical protein